MSFRLPAKGLLLLVLLGLAPSLHAAIPTSERNALIAFYNATGGPNWTNNSGWLGAPGTECSWVGVLCNAAPNFVAILSLPANNLTGPLPVELAQLTMLDQLNLRRNALTGSIPKELANLPLSNLRLAENKLTGTIPPELGSNIILRTLHLDTNDLTGGIPAALGQLSLLTSLRLHTNPRLGGTLPPELGSLRNLQELLAYDSGINGTIPPEFGGMTALLELRIGGNNLTGTIPPEIANLRSLGLLILRENRLEGPIPSWLGSMTSLTTLNLGGNRFTGPIPPELGNLSRLTNLLLYDLPLSGTIPAELGNLTQLSDLRIFNTEIGGPIPAFLGSLPNIITILLDGNRLTGGIPSSLGTRTRLTDLTLSNNALTGEIPSSLGNLVNLIDDLGLDLRYNGLTSSDPALVSFLESKQIGPESFTSLQTVAPTGVLASANSPASIAVKWTPIDYQANSGGYQIEVATSPGGPFRIATTTPNKSAGSAQVSGLAPSTTYHFRLSAITYGGSVQKNTIVSATTAPVSATTLASVASVVLTVAPPPISVLADGVTTATTRYTLSNVGQRGTTVTLTQNGGFFTQSPLSFTLPAGASQEVTITSLPQASSTGLRGSSTPAGAGVPSNLIVPVSLLASAPPAAGDPLVVVTSTRVDVAGPANTNPSGSVKFRNVGTAPAIGLLSADVGWIVPDPAVITIEPGQEVTASFTVNRSRRPDAASLSGTLTATLSFVYLARSGVSGRSTFAGLPTLAAPVPVGDTVQPPVTPSGIPLLGPNEIGLVVPGVGNITGSVGLFISDISIGNALSGLSASDLELYYFSGGSSLSASQPVAGGQSLNLADVVSSVFQRSEQIGALHLRGTLASQLGVNANVFNKSNPAGTYGSAIPVFRTNRALGNGESWMIAGLRKTATSHTNIYLQEVAGTATSVDVKFLSAAGQTLGLINGEAVGPFVPVIVGQERVPEGTVSALVTNRGDGGVVAYATPVDRSSGDTWAVTDWNRYFGRSGTEQQVIPVAGSAPGRNETYFRTDVAIANPGSTTATGVLRYFQQSPAVVAFEKTVSIETGRTLVLEDAVVSFFGAAAPSLGHVVLVPSDASLTMSSRTYTTVQGTSKTFGTGVPTMTRTDALRLGQAKVFGAVKDSTAATTNAARPGTFRTNVGLVETEGEPVTVRVSILLFDGRQLAAGGSAGEKLYVLAPNEFRQLNAIVSEVLGSSLREASFGELDNVQVKVEVTAGSGGLLVYATSTDNGTGDTVLRIE